MADQIQECGKEEEQSQRRENNVCFGRCIQMELPSRQSVC